jgi:hypothetical protein
MTKVEEIRGRRRLGKTLRRRYKARDIKELHKLASLLDDEKPEV